MDLVSVIIPYFKKKDTILSSINSVLDQTYKNFEIIIVYDDESESDWNFVKEIKNMDQRISVIQNKQKKGWKIKKYWNTEFKWKIYCFSRCR